MCCRARYQEQNTRVSDQDRLVRVCCRERLFFTSYLSLVTHLRCALAGKNSVIPPPAHILGILIPSAHTYILLIPSAHILRASACTCSWQPDYPHIIAPGICDSRTDDGSARLLCALSALQHFPAGTHALGSALLKISVRTTLPVEIEAHGLRVFLHNYPFSDVDAWLP